MRNATLSVQAAAVQEAVQRLDTMKTEPSQFEANVLNTVLRQLTQGRQPSEKQRRILAEMVEQYLDAPQLAAELRGQQRLFG